MVKGFGSGVFVVMMLVVALGLVFADPTPPYTIGETDSRRADNPEKTVEAQAGNITELLINATVITKTWQGYFGNITGKIILDNTENMSLYDWDLTVPEGEVYATNDTITDWSGIRCFNYSAGSPELNLSELESVLDCDGDADGVNETFNAQTHPSFWVGSQQISSDSCWSTQTYSNDGAGSNFYEVLLIEPTKNIIVYTSLINASKTGFDNTPTDFQMLVGENGHGTQADTTTQYYFYVELY